jgi:hypothetical protein
MGRLNGVRALPDGGGGQDAGDAVLFPDRIMSPLRRRLFTRTGSPAVRQAAAAIRMSRRTGMA